MIRESWIKSDAYFGVPMVCLTVSMRDACCHEEVKKALLAAEKENVEHAIRILERLVAFFRPELKGGSICAVESRCLEPSWRLLYTHPSLTRTNPGEMVAEMRLVKNADEADTPVLMESQS